MLLSDVLLSDKAERDLINVPLPDPTWETVTQLFPSRIGMKILLAILASARIVQRTLPECGQADVAVLSRKNLAGFAKQLGCGKDTFLRYIKTYQSIGLLTHSRTWSERNSVTELHLPLIPYQPSAVALQRVEALMRGGRKKQQDLARYVRDRYILLYGLPARDNQETEARSDLLVGLLSKVSRLLQKNRLGRIERQVLCCEIADVLRHQQGDLRTGEIPQRGDPCSALQGHAIQTKGLPPPLVSLLGDLPENQGREVQAEEGDLPPQGEDPRNQFATLPGDLPSEGGDLFLRKEIPRDDQTTKKGDFCAQESKKMQQPGDLEAREALPSSIEFLSLDRDTLGKELELESPTGDPWTGSEEDLFQEAVRYLKLLDGPEYATPDYLNTHAGKKAVGGYKNKIRRSPRLARIAAINTLLQRTFYDLTRQKKPLENAGKWFHSSFDRYADSDRPMEITGEILDWSKSPYTLQEIALVLPRERKRQETQWWSSEAPHLPFSSCVTIHQHLQDDTAALPMSVSQKQRESFRFGTARHYAETSIGVSSPQLMSFAEAEQLAEEIRREACWYLEEIHVSAEPRLDENAYVVEAFIAQTTFPISYTCRHDWWLHHQEQVGHQIREGHNKGRTYANSPC